MTSDPDFLSMTSYQGILSTVCLAGLPDSASMIANSADFTQFSATFFQISHIKSQMLPLRPTWGLRNKYQDKESQIQYSYQGCQILQAGLSFCGKYFNYKNNSHQQHRQTFPMALVALIKILNIILNFKNYDFYIIVLQLRHNFP